MLSDLTDGLPGWLGIVLIVVVVGVGWFLTRRLYDKAYQRADRVRLMKEQRAWAAAQRATYARGPRALAADPDAFALAASAWLAQSYREQPLDQFVYRHTDELTSTVLPVHYHVDSPGALPERIAYLLVEGHRAFPHGDEHGDIDLTVWDLVRVIDLARIGAAVGALDESTARGVARFAAGALQQRYDEWPALGAQIERGFRHTHEPRTRHGEQLADVQCGAYRRVLSAPDGPWSVVPWSAAIAPGDLGILDGARATPGPLLEAWEQPIRARLGAR